jgi:Tfp pilus assembly protein PilF
MSGRTTILHIGLLVGVVTLAYANHFHNEFHFDDGHAIVENGYIRDLHNTGLFFTDTRTSSTLPPNRVYRPLVMVSLAVDYALGGGLKPFYFQLSTFLWFCLQLVLMYALFRKLFEMARPDPRNRWAAFFGAALYGLHPAIAETVNYIVQRADVYSTLGMIASLTIYASFPGRRAAGWYLVPFAGALLSKPPALIFPALLFVYVRLFEEENLLTAARRCVPALLVDLMFGSLVHIMTPSTFVPADGSAYAYRITQPVVALRYFRSFFLPTRLTADTDFPAASGILDDGVWGGFAFAAAMIGIASWCSRRVEWRPAAFGLWWFLLGLVPTAVFPLAEVENDHRMYLPFVGLVLAISWHVALSLYRRRALVVPTAIASVLVCIVSAGATWQRNKVWATNESLWFDVTVKSPRNGRGLMNYGLTRMEKGDYRGALDYFTRALIYTPNYYPLEINLGIANGGLKQDNDAERHFQRAISLAPNLSNGYFFYGRWLSERNRLPEATAQLERAVSLNSDDLNARDLLMQLHAWEPRTAEDYLNLSLHYHRSGKYEECIQAARQALRLRPSYPEAYNNIAAAYEDLHMWNEAIEAAQQALRLKPDFELARNNLAWAQSQKIKVAQKP